MKQARNTDLMAVAGKVVEESLQELPAEIREIANEIPVLLFKEMPPRFVEEGLEPDTLGLFEGGSLGEENEAGQARIYLFLGNLFDCAEGDPAVYREEVRVTLLHELGHLIGLDEDDLFVRGLD